MNIEVKSPLLEQGALLLRGNACNGDDPEQGTPVLLFLNRDAPPLATETVLANTRAAGVAHAVTVDLDSEGTVSLRFFNPADETPLCITAALCAAEALRDLHLVEADEMVLHTAVAPISLTRENHGWLVHTPALAATTVPTPMGLGNALGAVVLRSERTPLDDLLVELARPEQVETVAPDLDALAAIAEAQGLRGFALTAHGKYAPQDFTARYLAPDIGVLDVVCRSALVSLAGYWAERLGRARMRMEFPGEPGAVVPVVVRPDGVTQGVGAMAFSVGYARPL